MKTQSSNFFLIVFLIAGLFLTSKACFADDKVSLGRQAEQDGNLNQALTLYVEGLKSDETNQLLREKIIELAGKIQPPPAIPEEAERHMARGRAAVKSATDNQGFLKAAEEFQAAIDTAPWLATVYFNLGVVLDKAGNYENAIKNIRLYLTAFPDDREAKSLIYEIEYRQEEAARQKTEETGKNAAELSREKTLDNLTGYWRWYLKDSYYNSDIYQRIHLEGDEVVMTTHAAVASADFKVGDRIKEARFRTGGLDGHTLLDRDGKAAGTISKDFREIRIFLRLPGMPDYNYVYHKCGAISIDSCGR